MKLIIKYIFSIILYLGLTGSHGDLNILFNQGTIFFLKAQLYILPIFFVFITIDILISKYTTNLNNKDII